MKRIMHSQHRRYKKHNKMRKVQFLLSKLKIPVIQAPMAGGINNPRLSAAVANCGGIGSLGFAYSTPEKIFSDLEVATNLTKGHLNANFFIFPDVEMPSVEKSAQIIQAFSTTFPANAQYLDGIPAPPYHNNLDECLEPVWKFKPSLLTFHFGLPPNHVIDKAKELGIYIGVTATSQVEARLIEASGADFIVAQGIEAGGHYGIFDPKSYDVSKALSTSRLVSKLKKTSKLPIVAAGGIMDGTDMFNMIREGAIAVQMGTAFIACPESTASEQHKKAILSKKRDTVLSNKFSGRTARMIGNSFTDKAKDLEVFPFPAQNSFTSRMRKAAQAAKDIEHQAMFTGMNYHRARELTVQELMTQLRREYTEAKFLYESETII